MIEEILECAKAVKADAIVMGRHGHGAMYNLLVGSVTEGVLKRATCPVVLVPSENNDNPTLSDGGLSTAVAYSGLTSAPPRVREIVRCAHNDNEASRIVLETDKGL